MPTRPEHKQQPLTMNFPWTFAGPCPTIWGYPDCSGIAGPEFKGTRFENVSAILTPYFKVDRLPGESIAQLCERAAAMRGDVVLTDAASGDSITVSDLDADWEFDYTFHIGGA